jgi:hypothetical protein
MSCNEWEKGSWKLSCAEFRKLRNYIIDGYNELQDRSYQEALRVKDEFNRLRKNKAEAKQRLSENFCNLPLRNPDALRVLFRIACERINKHLDEDVVRRSMMMDCKEVVMGNATVPATGVEAWVAEQNRIRYSGMGRRVDAQGKIWGKQWTPRKTPKTPKKKDFPKATKAATSFSVGGEAHITLNADTRVVTWEVYENNHACDHAAEEPMAKVFWRAISSVNWTRGTGGRLWGSDEYRDDANREHGYSGDMTKRTWGNETEARAKRFASTRY